MAITPGTFIHGRLQASGADPVDLINPATGEVARRIVPSTPAVAVEAILDARAAQPHGRPSSPSSGRGYCSGWPIWSRRMPMS